MTPTGSPVASVVARIDGRKVTPGRVPLWRVDLGRAVLVVTATDEAGNTTTVRRVFRVRTSLAAVRTLVQRFADAGSVPRKVEVRVLAKLRQAANHARRDRDRQAVAALRGARKAAGGIKVAAHRKVVRGDLGVIIRRLR
ncbi:hypothetical protein [Nocardioides sp. TF02-7]|uniref:FIMAH domain-containing protein n=1 Tax=Nocardioides sp. TF02-7 TaxID=2917724 RepID=UPI001F0617A9|nr:hypothetical protein [Nocardioides sp. TF02-7]UMG94479.1 hypothetical protein MF408_11180 [Nocardioides sp. TF02-7]